MALDPWDWEVDDVVYALCHPQGELRAHKPNDKFDFQALETTVRENDLKGEILLIGLSRETLKVDLEIKSYGLRFKIWKAIEEARKSSAKFKEFKTNHPDEIIRSFLPSVDYGSVQGAETSSMVARFINDDVQPELVPPPLSEEGENSPAIKISNIGQSPKGRTDKTITVDDRRQKKRKLAVFLELRLYLHGVAMPIDKLFYGNTEVNEEVKHEVLGLGQTIEDLPAGDFTILPRTKMPGTSIYVNNIIKAFLLWNNAHSPKYYEHAGKHAAGLQPVHSKWKRRKLSGISITVISRAQGRIIARRVMTKDWRYDSGYTKAINRSVTVARLAEEEPDQMRPLEDNSAPDQPGKIPHEPLPPDLAYLEKYLVSSNLDHVVPAYGDSGSEGGYDTETWNEIQAERNEKAPTGGLSLSQVQQIVRDAELEMKEHWKATKLPKLEANAWNTWSKPRSNNTAQDAVSQLHHENQNLTRRLIKLEAKICEGDWVKASEVKMQCKALEPTVIDLATVQWKLDLLQQEAPPPRPQTLAQARARPRAKTRPLDLAEDEEELTDTDLEGAFVVEEKPLTPIANEDQVVNGELPVPDTPASRMMNQQERLDEAKKRLAETEEIPALDSSADQGSRQVLQTRELAKFRRPRDPPPPLTTKKQVFVISSSEEDKTDFQSLTVVELRSSLRGWAKVVGQDGIDKTLWYIVRHTTLPTPAQMLALMNRTVEAQHEAVRATLRTPFRESLDLTDVDVDPEEAKLLAAYVLMWFKNPLEDPGKWGSERRLPNHLKKATLETWDEVVRGWPTFAAYIREKLEWLDGERLPPSTKKPKVARGKSASHHFKAYGAQQSRAGQDLQDRARERQLKAEQRQQELQKKLETTAGGESCLNPVVNLNRSEDDADIFIHPHIATRMKPHQLEGVQFIWRELVAEGAEQGCLIAQPMGMGKTMQVIAFLLTLAEAATDPMSNVRNQIPLRFRRPFSLILVPPALVENWYDELLKWLPPGHRNTIGDIHKVSNALLPTERVASVRAWNEKGGILLSSQTFFKKAVLDKDADVGNYADTGKILRSRPTVVVVDEAQEVKNVNSKLHEAVRQIDTRARIAMTGSPLANNLLEYFHLVDWIAEGFLGDIAEFQLKYVKPITAGNDVEANKFERRKGLKMTRILTQELAPKVHRAGIEHLHNQLHGKTEFIVRVQLTEMQRVCYKLYMDGILGIETGNTITTPRLWAFLALLKLLCNHPQCFFEKINYKIKLDHQPAPTQAEPDVNGGQEMPDMTDTDDEKECEKLQEDPNKLLGSEVLRKLANVLSQPDQLQALTHSNKMVVLFQIINQCRQHSEKLLIFSQSLVTMDYIEKRLRGIKVRMIRMDGSGSPNARLDIAREFNDGDSEVCLISTRAGGVGLNLFGASRVVIVDSSWNPVHEQQAIGRAYRIGQTRHVYVYYLIAAGSFEEDMRNQALFKEGLANRIVDNKNTVRNARATNRDWIRPPHRTDQDDLGNKDRDPKVLEPIVDDEEITGCFQSIQLGESFLVEEKEQLTKEEEAEAREWIWEEQLRRRDPIAYQKHIVKKQEDSLANSRAAMMVPQSNGATNTILKDGMLNGQPTLAGQQYPNWQPTLGPRALQSVQLPVNAFPSVYAHSVLTPRTGFLPFQPVQDPSQPGVLPVQSPQRHPPPGPVPHRTPQSRNDVDYSLDPAQQQPQTATRPPTLPQESEHAMHGVELQSGQTDLNLRGPRKLSEAERLFLTVLGGRNVEDVQPYERAFLSRQLDSIRKGRLEASLEQARPSPLRLPGQPSAAPPLKASSPMKGDVIDLISSDAGGAELAGPAGAKVSPRIASDYEPLQDVDMIDFPAVPELEAFTERATEPEPGPEPKPRRQLKRPEGPKKHPVGIYGIDAAALAPAVGPETPKPGPAGGINDEGNSKLDALFGHGERSDRRKDIAMKLSSRAPELPKNEAKARKRLEDVCLQEALRIERSAYAQATNLRDYKQRIDSLTDQWTPPDISADLTNRKSAKRPKDPQSHLSPKAKRFRNSSAGQSKQRVGPASTEERNFYWPPASHRGRSQPDRAFLPSDRPSRDRSPSSHDRAHREPGRKQRKRERREYGRVPGRDAVPDEARFDADTEDV